GHRLQRQERFTRLIHRFDRGLVTSRRLDGSKLTARVQDPPHSVSYRFAGDGANESLLLRGITDASGVGVAGVAVYVGADHNVVASGGEIETRIGAQRRVVVARSVGNKSGSSAGGVI